MCIPREERVVEVHSEGRGPEAETQRLAWCLCECMEANMADMQCAALRGRERCCGVMDHLVSHDGSPCEPWLAFIEGRVVSCFAPLFSRAPQ